MTIRSIRERTVATMMTFVESLLFEPSVDFCSMLDPSVDFCGISGLLLVVKNAI